MPIGVIRHALLVSTVSARRRLTAFYHAILTREPTGVLGRRSVDGVGSVRKEDGVEALGLGGLLFLFSEELF